MKVIVVGSGIGGVSAAYHLQKDNHDVTLIEKNDQIGGHAYHVEIDGERVDLGFMMYGDSNPNIKAWFKSLGLTKPDGTTNIRIPMSMSVTSELDADLSVFSSRRPFGSFRDVFNGKLWRIIVDIYRFTVHLLDMPDKGTRLTKDWIADGDYSPAFYRFYFLPFVAILWTIPKSDVLALPASQFLRCLKTHANSLYMPLWQVLLGTMGRRMDRPKHLWWYCGSKYHVPFLREFQAKGGKVRVASNVVQVGRGGTHVTLESGERLECDYVVLAGHAEESAKLLPWSPESVKSLNKFSFHQSMMYVHRDPKFLPPDRQAWGSWNVRITAQDEYIMTYWINRIQRLSSKQDVFVTITPLDYEGTKPKEDLVIMSFPWDHPKLLADCVPEQEIIQEEGISLAGAWLGRGFHEDGFVAGRRAAWIAKDSKTYKNVALYEDPDNVPIPAVPAFGMPWSVSCFFAATIALTSCACYQLIKSIK